MSTDLVSLQTFQKREPGSGPPFAANAADNGDSADPGTGHIVWGNDVGQAGNPAKLLKNREILMQAFLFFFNNGQLNAQDLPFDNTAFYLQGSWIMGRAVFTDNTGSALDAFADSNGILVSFIPPP